MNKKFEINKNNAFLDNKLNEFFSLQIKLECNNPNKNIRLAMIANKFWFREERYKKTPRVKYVAYLILKINNIESIKVKLKKM